MSYGSHNKLLHIWWLTITEVCSLTDLETRSLKSGCWRGLVPSQGSKGGSFLSALSFWWLWAFFGLWLCKSSLCLHPYLAFSSLCLLLSFIRTVTGFRAYMDNLGWSRLEILNLMTSANTLFPRVVIILTGGWGRRLGHGHIFWGSPFNPLQTLRYIMIHTVDFNLHNQVSYYWSLGVKFHTVRDPGEAIFNTQLPLHPGSHLFPNKGRKNMQVHTWEVSGTGLELAHITYTLILWTRICKKGWEMETSWAPRGRIKCLLNSDC